MKPAEYSNTTWQCRDGRVVSLLTVDDDHFKNIVVYLYTTILASIPEIVLFYQPTINQELLRRGLKMGSILSAGPQPYKDKMGQERIWDPEFNEDLILN